MKNSRRAIVIGSTIAAAGIVVAGSGVGYATNGNPFLLGRSNTESSKATLTNTTGTPLSLRAPAGKAPLQVSNEVKVARLNADTVDGIDSSLLQRKGTVVRRGEVVLTPSEGPINRQSRAFCAAGEHAVGGGGFVQALTADRLGEYFTFIVHSTPIDGTGGPSADAASSATGWLVEATNTANKMTGETAKNANLISYVVCEQN
jgi:hypothetical protein